MVYITADDVKAFSKIRREDLGYTAEADFDAFINTLIGYAESLINDYLNQIFTAETVPASVKYATVQLCSNILHIILQRKISPIVQTGDFTLRLVIPEAFTGELKGLLDPYRVLDVKMEEGEGEV